MQKKRYHVFCVVGDGELQEGSTWEALQFAVKHGVGNLTVIIDENRLQAMDFITNVLDVEIKDRVKKLKGFGLSPVVCPGHDVVKLAKVMMSAKASAKKVPSVIIAKTIKGYGLNCMENVAKFHFRIPACEGLASA
jgi:transketolase